MASYVNATTNKMVPIAYKCVNCGKDNVDIATISATGSARVKLIHDTSSADATAYSRELLAKKYQKLQVDVNNHKFGDLNCQGKCRECGTIQPWSGGRIKALVDKNIIAIWIGLFVLLCIVCVASGVGFTMAMLLGTAAVTFFLGSLIILGIREVAGIIGKSLALKGTADMIKNEKEECFPRIVIPHEDK